MEYIKILKNNISIQDLPSEACAFNGVYLEEMIEGYRTLTTRGRNTLEVIEHLSGDIIGRDGEIDFGSNVPSRLIEITYKLEASSPEDLVEKFDIIKNYLRNQDRLEMIFKDDSGFRYFGRLKSITEPTEGSLMVKGVMIFNCVDPYKYTELKSFGGGILADDSLLDYEVKIENIKVTLSADSNSVKVINDRNAESMTVTGSFVSGDIITFDFMSTKIFNGLVNITKDIAWESSYFPDMEIKNGDNLIVNPASVLEINYRGRRL